MCVTNGEVLTLPVEHCVVCIFFLFFFLLVFLYPGLFQLLFFIPFHSDQARPKPTGKYTHFQLLHNTFGCKEIGHLRSKDVKAESALDRYPDSFVLEIEQEQAFYEFLLPLSVSQIKNTMRVTSLTIFVSHSFFLMFLSLHLAYSLKGKVQREQYIILKCVYCMLLAFIH